MTYCILDESKIIRKKIICENDEDAMEFFGAMPSYEGARIGDEYNPPPPEPEPEPEPTEVQMLGREITALHLEQIEQGQMMTELQLGQMEGAKANV